MAGSAAGSAAEVAGGRNEGSHLRRTRPDGCRE